MAVAALCCFPVLLNLSAIRHPSLADPLVRDAQLTYALHRSPTPGLPSIDPNEGYTTQALGRRAALDLLQGEVPWWNPYSGVGLPLAGEMQPAALFPLVLVLALPAGMLLFKLILEIAAGVATYCLLRQLGLTRYIALFGGLLYSVNGSFAWLAHGPINPIPFLPLLVLGVERARASAVSGRKAGWTWIAVALALSLYAGFPEVAYINGLLAMVWALLRLLQIPVGLRRTFVRKLLAGGVLGLLLAAPVVIAFLDYLQLAYLGSHSGAAAGGHLPIEGVLQLFLPYVWGQIFAYNNVGFIWGGVGGYAGVGLACLALAGSLAMSREVALRRLLLVWALVGLSASFDVPGIRTLINLMPGASITVWSRYVPPSWEFALCVLAAVGLEEMRGPKKDELHDRIVIAVAIVLVATGVGFGLSFRLWRKLWTSNPDYGTWFLASVLAGLGILMFLAIGRLLAKSPAVKTALYAAVVLLEAAAYFVVPTMSYPVGATLALGGVEYLRTHLGLQRFYTLGPIAPNYGAYFGIASINHNYLPVTQAWVDYVHAHLDKYQAPDLFIGYDPDSGLSTGSADQLRQNLDQFELVGVKYVVADRAQDPLMPLYVTPTGTTNEKALQLTAGEVVRIDLTDPPPPGKVQAIAIYLGSSGDLSHGVLTASACSGGTCVGAAGPLRQSTAADYLDIPLERQLLIGPKPSRVSLLLTATAGSITLSLWPAGQDQGQAISAGGQVLAHRAIRLQFAYASPVSPDRYREVYADQVMKIYELANPRPYFGATGCTLTISSRVELEADCAAPSVLTRLEQGMSGWRAEVNGMNVPIASFAEIFQQINLPAGRSTVRFSFRPPYMDIGAVLFGTGAIIFLAALGLQTRALYRARRYGSDASD